MLQLFANLKIATIDTNKFPIQATIPSGVKILIIILTINVN